jgi:hypothetical protein
MYYRDTRTGSVYEATMDGFKLVYRSPSHDATLRFEIVTPTIDGKWVNLPVTERDWVRSRS